MLIALALLAAAASVAASGTSVEPADPGPDHPCLDEPTLVAFANCARDTLPRRDSERYTQPDERDRASFARLSEDLLTGHCDAERIAVHLARVYVVAPLYDADTARSYCVAVERPTTDGTTANGWPMLVFDAASDRELVVQAPHSIFETGTYRQATEVFVGSGARALVLGGTHRFASSAPVPGDDEHVASDLAHNPWSLFHVATEGVLDHLVQVDAETAVLQFHGMGTKTCPDADLHVTAGTWHALDASSAAHRLVDALARANPSWRISTSGPDATCWLDGASNVQSRLLNGVPREHVQSTWADAASGRFVHVEAHWDYRVSDAWVGAVIASGVGT